MACANADEDKHEYEQLTLGQMREASTTNGMSASLPRPACSEPKTRKYDWSVTPHLRLYPACTSKTEKQAELPTRSWFTLGLLLSIRRSDASSGHPIKSFSMCTIKEDGHLRNTVLLQGLLQGRGIIGVTHL